jgi:hypothetical protein
MIDRPQSKADISITVSSLHIDSHREKPSYQEARRQAVLDALGALAAARQEDGASELRRARRESS